MDEICRKVIDEAGGPAKLARELGDITSQAVSQWKRVPAERVRRIAEFTGIAPAILRPDLFAGMEDKGSADDSALDVAVHRVDDAAEALSDASEALDKIANASGRAI